MSMLNSAHIVGFKKKIILYLGQLNKGAILRNEGKCYLCARHFYICIWCCCAHTHNKRIYLITCAHILFYVFLGIKIKLFIIIIKKKMKLVVAKEWAILFVRFAKKKLSL